MRILVVEDEEEIADGIGLILRKNGYQVDCVHDGITGLDYISGNIYDLVLLDVMLPGIDGYDIIKASREYGIKTPIILLTAKSQTEEKIKGLNLGADDYITKPFDSGELLARIKVRLRNENLDSDGRIYAFDVYLNPLNYKLEKGLKSVKLSKKEYQLLEYLMLNKNQILSKDSIVYKVWGNEDDTDYNNIEVYISFLRKKLKFVDANAVICTKKGVGYSFSEGGKE